MVKDIREEEIGMDKMGSQVHLALQAQEAIDSCLSALGVGTDLFESLSV